MDELSLLEADSIESASSSLPAPDFTGSLDYIDSLASRRAFALSQRDVASITTALTDFDYLSPKFNRAVLSPTDVGFRSSTDFRPLGDARRFNPESVRPPRALVRSSARVVAHTVSPRNDFPPSWHNPLDPQRPVGDINRSLRDAERRILRRPFSFKKPNQVVICLKRKIRRNVLGAMGFPSMRPWVKPRRNYWSRVFC